MCFVPPLYLPLTFPVSLMFVMCFQVAKEHPFMPLQDVAVASGAVPLHTSQISSRLQNAGLRTYKPSGKLLLTERHKADRLLFAQEHLERHNAEFWRSVVFSDEKIFRTDTVGRVRVRRPR